MAEMDEDGPQVSDNSSQHSTHRTLNIDEKNEIFLKMAKGTILALDHLWRH
ncbi:hypothetical protein AtNW77_Chr5g0115601 [Arabidopsis thaliana]